MGWSLLRQGYGGQADSRRCPPGPPKGRSLVAPWRWIVSSEMNSGRPEFKVPSSSGRSFLRFFADMPRSKVDPGETTLLSPNCEQGDAGFSILLVDLLSHLNNYGAISIFRCLRDSLWPIGFPVYASSRSFRHPSPSQNGSGDSLFTRCLPRPSMT